MSTTTDQRGPGGLPEDDVVHKLLDQHARIRSLFDEVRTSRGSARQQAFEELRALLVVHETAEEMIVRPVIRHLVGDREPDARDAEEAEAAKELERLSALSVDDAEFSAHLDELEKAVDAHAHAEATYEFHTIADSCSAEERVSMGRQLDAALKVAPTRPHPALMGHETVQLTLGPLAGLVDRTRDAIRRATA